MRWLMEKLVKLAIRYCEKRGKVFQITGGKRGDTVYLQRYILFKYKPLGCIYIHRFLRSDADVPHDHPWNFFTYVITRGYTEHYYDTTKPRVKNGRFVEFWTEVLNRREPGSIAYRKSTDIHRVSVDEEIDLAVGEDAPEKLARAPLTICFMGPRRRQWGFWEHSSRFIDWRDYLDITVNDARIEGGE